MPWKKTLVEQQRRALVETLLLNKEAVGVICERAGVSRQTAYKFLRRFLAGGWPGLKDRSRRPLVLRTSQAVGWRHRVLQLRRTHPTWGSRKLLWLLKRRFKREGVWPAERTVQRWLRAAGCVRVVHRRRRARPADGVRSTVARCSNAVWTFDLKGWFLTSDGTKIEPLTVRDHWSSFILWVRPLAPRNDAGVRRVCRRLFRRYGRPRVIRCDRGAPFFGDGPHAFTRLSLWWWRLGIRVEFVRRGAIDNNAHEQMHGVMKQELKIAPSSITQTQRLERWRRLYNEQRPHDGRGMRLPAALYRPRPGALPKLRTPQYPAHWFVRRVQPSGMIQFHSWRGCIGRAFGQLHVGLQPVGPRSYRIYFDDLYLATLDLDTGRKLLIARF